MNVALSRATNDVASVATENRKLAAVVLRYALSAAGPVCISAAHFLAAIVFLHAFSRAEFGTFSFLLVIVPFCLSIAGSMIGAPATVSMQRGSIGDAALATYLKTNLVIGAAGAVCVLLLMRSTGADWLLSLVMGAYAGVMTLRSFARTLTYARGLAARVVLSDVLYGVALSIGLVLLFALRSLTALGAAEVLLVSCSAALMSFGRQYLREQFRPSGQGTLLGYRRIWNSLARWSAVGVVLTELTANAHAYLVTFIAGPAAFAPLAVGALLMRPVQLVLAALPDRERPAMARLLGSGDYRGPRRSVNDFRMAAGAVWLATVILAAGLLLWFPQLILRNGYNRTQALAVLGFFSAITAVRSFRTPESVLLQAAGQFRALARASLWSCLVSLAATLALLIVGGPVASLGGILAGEIVVTACVRAAAASWMQGRA